MNPENKNDISNDRNNDVLLVITALSKRVDQLEESHKKQQERINTLERENQVLKTELNLNNGKKEGGSVLKGKRTDQVHEEETQSKTLASPSVIKKTNTNNNDDNEAVVIPRPDNGASFGSLPDDLRYKILEFNGKNSYSQFGLIDKRCRNMFNMEEYNLKKQTCVYAYGTLEMIVGQYLQNLRDGTLGYIKKFKIVYNVFWCNRLDAIDWIVQLGDIDLLLELCQFAAFYGRINILSRVFCKCNLTILDKLLDADGLLCSNAAYNGKLETLKWLRNHGAEFDAEVFSDARDKGNDEIIQYLRSEGCPES